MTDKISRMKINQRGQASILLAFLVLTVVLTIGLGLSALAFKQIKTMREVSFSVEALYAADAGAEKCLYQVRQEIGSGCDVSGGGTTSMELSPGLSFIAKKEAGLLINSKGTYKTTSRKIELTWTE